MKTLAFQTGMSLVELMVAVTLSLILMAGVIQIHVSSKASYQVQHQLSALQQNQRMAVELLSRDIRKAGLSINQAITNYISGVDGGDSASDEITVRYESDKNCFGYTTDGIAENRYFIEDGVLKCQGVYYNDTDKQNEKRTEELVPGVIKMQILYGEDTDPIVPGAVRTANRYVVPDQANMANVVSVRISLLVETDGVVRGVDEGKAVERDYYLLDAPKITFSDQKRREAVTTTIRLRNVG